MGSGRPDLGSDRPDWGSERPILRPRRLFSRLRGGTDGRTDGNRKICPMWNHRSSAPPGPLPKKQTQTYRPMDRLTSHACNKAGYTATLVVPGWAGAVLEKVTRASGQELYAQKTQKR